MMTKEKEKEVEVPVHVDGRFPLKQKIDMLREELVQTIRDIDFLHKCTGSEYAARRKYEIAQKLEEIDQM